MCLPTNAHNALIGRRGHQLSMIWNSGFWSRSHRFFFDIRVFNPSASTYSKPQLKAVIGEMSSRNGDNMMKESGESSLVHLHPIVFTTAGMMGQSATTFYKRLASGISDHYNKPYSYVLNWIPMLFPTTISSALPERIKIFSPSTSVLLLIYFLYLLCIYLVHS